MEQHPDGTGERYEKRAMRIANLEQANAQLRAENAELKRDAERLNWLESNPRHAQIVVDGKMTNCVFYGISCAELMKLRDAIDAAMKGKT